MPDWSVPSDDIEFEISSKDLNVRRSAVQVEVRLRVYIIGWSWAERRYPGHGARIEARDQSSEVDLEGEMAIGLQGELGRGMGKISNHYICPTGSTAYGNGGWPGKQRRQHRIRRKAGSRGQGPSASQWERRRGDKPRGVTKACQRVVSVPCLRADEGRVCL